MQPVYHLRPAEASDYDFLWSLTVTTMRDYVVAIWGWDEEWQVKRFRENFNASHWRIIVVNGEDAGGLQARVRPTDGDLFLSNIYLMPKFQCRGIGSAVIRVLIAQAQSQKLPLTLNVLKSNPDARRLYERLGLQWVNENEQRWFMSTAIVTENRIQL